MSEKYQQIKHIFSDALETEYLKGISIKNYISKKTYIKEVYNYISEGRYAEMKRGATRFLEITHSQLDELFSEIICSNLYCDLSLLIQVISGKTERREYFLGKLAGLDNENKKLRSRIEKRIEPNRINIKEELKTLSDNEHNYFAPTLISAYKDTLFVKRAGTDILDISCIFIDVFKALFCDSDEQAKDSTFTKNVRLIKGYRLWKFTPDTILHVANIYQQVFDSENPYKYAEIMLLEKLFGLLTLNEIVSKTPEKKALTLITKGMGKINCLGYSSMTRLISSKLNQKNYMIFEDFITTCVHSLCSKCINAILKDVITYIARVEAKEREKVVEGLLEVCYSNITPMHGENFLENMKADCIIDMFRVLFDLPVNSKGEDGGANVLKIYLTSLDCSYSYIEDTEDDNKTISFVNDRSYGSLSHPQYVAHLDFGTSPKNNKSTKNGRIEY